MLSSMQSACTVLYCHLWLVPLYHFSPHYLITSVPLQAWSGPEGSRNLRFPDFMTTAQGGGKVVSLTHRLHLPPENSLGTHFCWRLSRPQGLCVIGRIMSMKNSNDTIWNRTSDLNHCATPRFPHYPINDIFGKNY